MLGSQLACPFGDVAKVVTSALLAEFLSYQTLDSTTEIGSNFLALGLGQNPDEGLRSGRPDEHAAAVAEALVERRNFVLEAR